MNKKAILLTILLLNLTNRAFADIYKWIDNKGITHLTNDKRDIPKESQNKIETPLIKKEIVPVKDGYLEVEETPNGFGFTYHKKDGKGTGCYEEWHGNTAHKKDSKRTDYNEEWQGHTANMCKDLYNQIINAR